MEQLATVVHTTFMMTHIAEIDSSHDVVRDKEVAQFHGIGR